jgi:hypothetical protein
MTADSFIPSRSLAGALLAAALVLPGTACAHGDAGEHVEEFHKHIDDYASNVDQLSRELDKVVTRYRQGNDAPAAMEEFVARWKDVEYHAAVENVTPPLYAPIWQGITAVREAVKQSGNADGVADAARQLRAALHQGLGGLKIKAQGDTATAGGGDTAGEGGVHATLKRIRGHLDKAVHEYENGHGDDAKSLIQDAYFNNFEGLEGDLIEADADLVAGLEEDFNAGLPGLINDGAPVSKVRDKVEAIGDKLDRAEKLLEEAEGHGEVF